MAVLKSSGSCWGLGVTVGTVPSLSRALPRLDVPCDSLKTTRIPCFGVQWAGRSPWHTLDWTVRPVGHTLSLSGCRGQCGPGRNLPGTFPFPTRLPSSDVSLFPLARPELWIHSSPAQLWANLALPLPLPMSFLCHKRGFGVSQPLSPPCPHCPQRRLSSCISLGSFSQWFGSSGKLHPSPGVSPTLQGGDKPGGGRAEGGFP